MISESTFVWAYLPGDTEPTLCGRYTHSPTPAGAIGRFIYGQSYLGNARAEPIDPVSLPLASAEHGTSAPQGLFGVLADATPDDWGRYVIDRRFGRQPSPVGYLLKAAQDRVGHLAFSAAKEGVENAPPLPGRGMLPDALRVIVGLEAGRPIPPELEAHIRPNTGLGGARPKLTIAGEGEQWLAKFPSMRDLPEIPIARLEAAGMELARRCGIEAAQCEVAHLNGTDVLLVKRFDRTALTGPDGQRHWGRDAFVSARTIFMSDPAVQAYSFSGSYPRLARELGRWSAAPAADRAELFRRMVFNCVIGNMDDHDRNHGFVADDLRPSAYRISPAYDLVPDIRGVVHTARRYQALGVGDQGALATVENILSGCEAFGIEPGQAARIVQEIQERALDQWRACCSDLGLDGPAWRQLEGCVAPIPASEDELPAAGHSAQPSHRG